MEPWTIGAAAAHFGVTPSALRHFEDLGLLRPTRVHGQRRYDRAQLRRLAFLSIARECDLPLRSTAAVLDGAGDRWREEVRTQLAALDARAERIAGARRLLADALRCPSRHPAAECTALTAGLDAAIDGPH